MPTSDGTGTQMSDGMVPESAPAPLPVPAAESEPGPAPVLPLLPQPDPQVAPVTEALSAPWFEAPLAVDVPAAPGVAGAPVSSPGFYWPVTPEAQRAPVLPSLASAFGTPPPPPTPPVHPGRRRRLGFIALAVIAVLGLAIGLLVAQPWKPPPLLAPVAVRAETTSTTAATVSWQQAPGGRKPDSWVVVRNGLRYAVLPGTQLTFADGKLAPGGSYNYRIFETSGTAQSPGSALASVTTTAPSVRNLRQVAKDWTTVTLRWDPPTGAPTPDSYAITDSNGNNVGSVAGNVTTYTITHLTIGGGPDTYSVAAVWSGNQSDNAPSVQAVTRQPPLNSDYSMSYYDATSPGGTMTAGTKWTDGWTFTPSCAGNTCKEGLQASFQPPATSDTPFNVTLKPSGGGYAGTTQAEIFACSSTPTASFLDTTNDTVNVDITPVHTSGGVWTSFTGTVVVTMPYTVPALQPNYYCPTQSWTFTVTGHPAS